jgi:hypothetical protein
MKNDIEQRSGRRAVKFITFKIEIGKAPSRSRLTSLGREMRPFCGQ